MLLTNDQINQVLDGFHLNRPEPLKPVKKPLRLPSVRFGFVRSHMASILRRWQFNDRTRRNLFKGSPVFYLLCL